MQPVTSFSAEELSRYSRHISIPDFGIDAQKRLKAASILVIGAGGLGSPALLYLAAAGFGKIGLVDFDVVDPSNLQRQILYRTKDVASSKAMLAERSIKELNPFIEVVRHELRLTSENALSILKEYDVVLDGTDNFPTRYLVNDACVILGRPLIYGSIYQFEGQVSVFNLNRDSERSPNYRDLFPTPPPPGLVPNCAEGGVLGVLPGIIGSMQANEAIKVAANIGEPLDGRLFIFDALHFSTTTLNVAINRDLPPITHLIDYEEFCGIKKQMTQPVNSISVQELEKWKSSKVPFTLIDVREPYEAEIVRIGGTLIPLATLADRHEEIPDDVKVVFHCRSGARSEKAIRQLSEIMPIHRFYNLEGGVLAYIDEIDPTLTRY